jgi:hypothetical protein
MIAGIAAEKIKFTRIKKLVFCIGSLIPDLSPMQFFKRHFYESSGEYVFEKLKKLNGKTSLYSVFRYGKMAHYVSDFCCHVHSDGKIGNALEHIKYERGLNKYLIKNFRDIKSKSNLHFDGKDLKSVLKDYMQAKKSCFVTDITYAVEACCSICEMAENRFMPIKAM